MSISHTTYDQIFWSLTTNGIFSIKSSYTSLAPFTIQQHSYKWIWQLKIPPKISFFLWLLSHNRLPTAMYLSCLGILPSLICLQCHMAPETTTHIFLECPNAIPLWAYLKLYLPSQGPTTPQTDNTDWLYNTIHTPLSSTPHKIPPTILLPFALWYLWIIRNKNTLESKNVPINIQLLINTAEKYYFLTHNNLKKIT